MPEGSMISYAQNAEDIVLWRALQNVPNGRYLEVGANHPRIDSVSRVFYDRGWSGITIEPLEEFIALHRSQRPRDKQVQVAVSDSGTGSITLHTVPGTGLSSTVDAIGEKHRSAGRAVADVLVPVRTLNQVLEDAGWSAVPIHFMVVDVEGAEGAVLRGLDLRAYRPWVIVVEATEPLSTKATHKAWEPYLQDAGYVFCLFDGLSRFYVAEEHHSSLAAALSYPACIFDDYIPVRFHELIHPAGGRDIGVSEIERQVIYWKHKALVEWADAWSSPEAGRLQRELDDLQRTVSWRVTRPLRFVRRAMGRLR